jgi:hypothetical protein
MKMPAGKPPQIPLHRAFQRYLERRRQAEQGELSPDEAATETDAATAEMCTAFKRGDLVAKVFDGTEEWTLTTDQWEEALFPERLLLAGAILDPGGAFADYDGLHPYTDEAVFQKWLAGVFRNESKTTQKQPRDGDQQLRKRLIDVVSFARNRWGAHKKRPGLRQMATHIKSQKKDQGFSDEALRKILSGRYEPMRRLGLKGIDQ